MESCAIPVKTPEFHNPVPLAGEEIEVVEFSLGSTLYAINLFNVKEIVEYRKITPLPKTPPHILGIIDLRGEITVIIDIKQRMAIGKTPPDPEKARIIVLDPASTSGKFGILVDDVTSVLSIKKERIDQMEHAEFGTESHILGIIKQKREGKESEIVDLLIWIDIHQILHE